MRFSHPVPLTTPCFTLLFRYWPFLICLFLSSHTLTPSILSLLPMHNCLMSNKEPIGTLLRFFWNCSHLLTLPIWTRVDNAELGFSFLSCVFGSVGKYGNGQTFVSFVPDPFALVWSVLFSLCGFTRKWVSVYHFISLYASCSVFCFCFWAAVEDFWVHYVFYFCFQKSLAGLYPIVYLLLWNGCGH